MSASRPGPRSPSTPVAPDAPVATDASGRVAPERPGPLALPGRFVLPGPLELPEAPEGAGGLGPGRGGVLPFFFRPSALKSAWATEGARLDPAKE